MKKRIGIFSHDFFPIAGGMGQHIYQLYLKNEQQKNLELMFFSPNTNNLTNHFTLFPETKESKLKNIEFSIKLALNFESIIFRHKLDIVHLHGGPGGIFLFQKLSIPTIYTCHHTYWQQYHLVKNQQWKYFFYKLEKASYHRSDKIICVSNDTAEVLVSNYGIKKENLIYIPNALNKSPKKTITPNNNLEILYIGRIDERKGVNFLVKTMQIVKKQNPKVKLHIVGEGSSRKKLENFSIENNLNIQFHGRLSDKQLDDLYENVSIQIVPSVFEGFGISVLEGMAKGIPVIGTDVAGIRSLISNKKDGLLVNYGNEKELASSIIKLLSDRLLQKKLTVNATKKLEQFNLNTIYGKYVDFYQNFS